MPARFLRFRIIGRKETGSVLVLPARIFHRLSPSKSACF